MLECVDTRVSTFDTGGGSLLRRAATKLIDPRYRRLHLVVVVVALAVHSATHYATFVPALRPIFSSLPYFRLHALHEAEFLLIIAYAGVVLGLRAGLVTLFITAATSVPFILSPYVFGRDPRPNELRDLSIQVGLILVMGLLIILLNDRDQRRRAAEAQGQTLREVDRVRSNFMSMAAHELRTPLTTLVGFTDLLLTREAPRDQQVEWLRTIHRESERLTHMVEELLNVSRIEAGHLDLATEELDLRRVVDAAAAASGLPARSHRFVVDIPPGLPAVAADENKLTQVLINLLSNAVKYSPKGGAVLLSALYDEQTGRVRIAVVDQGLGISPEDQERLFTSFYRIKSPETRNIEGTGLGLSIVKSLIELMGGSVTLDSKVGRGSTFAVELPAWREGLTATAA